MSRNRIIKVALVIYAALVITGISFTSSAPPAQAHAILLSSTPAQAENLPSLPANVVLEFSEPVGLEFSTIDLYGSKSQPLPGGQLTRSGTRDTTAVLPTGGQVVTGVIYVVWRVVSGVDGHLTSGSYWFTVGEEFAGAEPAAGGFAAAPYGGSSAEPDLPRLLARFVILAASALLLGGSVFAVLIIEPVLPPPGPEHSGFDFQVGQRFAVVGMIAGMALAIALMVDLLAQTATVGGTDYIGAFGQLDMAQLLLSSTRYGFAWVLKLLSALTLAAIMLFTWATRKTTNSWEVAIAAASLLLLAEALSSHAAAAQSGSIGGIPIPVISDWLHLVVASLWAGGLLFMVTTLFPIMKRSGLGVGDRAAYLRRVIPRFSRLAVISVLLLAATGTYNLLVHTVDPLALFDVAYGWVLGAKVALFLAVVLLGARNLRLYGTSAMKSSDTQDGVPEFKLSRNVRLEALLLLVAFSSAGALTLLPPPTATGRTSTAYPTSVNLTTLDSIEADSGEYTATLTVKKSSAAELFEVALAAKNAGAPPLTDIGKVLLRITPQQGRIATTSVEAKPVGDTSDNSSTWRAASSLTVEAGTYLVAVIAQRSTVDDLKTGFTLRRETDGTISLTNWDLIEARVSTDPDPPVTGRNTLRVRVVDTSGIPINQGAVYVTLEHQASGRTTSEARLKPVSGTNGTFEGTIEFDRAGSWTILTRLVTSGQPDTILDVSLDVSE